MKFSAIGDPVVVNSGHIHTNAKTHKSFKFLVLLGTSASIKLLLVSCLLAYLPVSENPCSNCSVHSFWRPNGTFCVRGAICWYSPFLMRIGCSQFFLWPSVLRITFKLLIFLAHCQLWFPQVDLLTLRCLSLCQQQTIREEQNRISWNIVVSAGWNYRKLKYCVRDFNKYVDKL